MTPRGHTERIESQVAQCEALLKRYVPGFELEKLEEILLREGLDIPSQITSPQTNFQFQQPPPPGPYRPGAPNAPQQPPPPQPGVYYPAPPNMMGPPPPGYIMPPYGPHFHPMQIPPPGYNPHIHPAFQQPPPGYQPPPMPQVQPHSQPQAKSQSQTHRPDSSKGLDPNGNDMSNTEVQHIIFLTMFY